jgi:radical SAM protein with 4Fe4S-binding SPASM domain
MKLIEKIMMPHLDWIQIEVSGLCNASCFYCPNTLYRKNWDGRILTLNEFMQIVPYLKKVKLLHLQGWGEPFLNPDFFKFVKIAKKSGCKVGTTTNGMLLKESQIEKIIESKIDIIAFSLAGINKNDELRAGTKIEKIFDIINDLNKIKTRKKISNPKIHIAYMLLKSNFYEFEEIPEVFHNKKIDQVVISLLDFIPDPYIEKESIIPKAEKDFEELGKKALDIIVKGKKLNLSISFNIPHPFKKGEICSERPLSSLFINSLGDVSPCVFTGIPSKISKNLKFGNINETTLPKIWRNIEYRNFRKSYTTSFSCINCTKLRILQLS